MKDLIQRCWNDPVFRHWILPFALALTVLAIWTATLAHSRDQGQWENADPRISEWYRTLMQPDNPNVPCCGEADAYWADEYHVNDKGELIVTITDTRPDEPLKRPHIPVGTKFIVPATKLTYRRGNPTGHAILFVSPTPVIYCFVQNGGV